MRLVPGEVMPALHRSLGGVIRRLADEVRDIAAREELDPKEVIDNIDVSADFIGFGDGMRIEVAYRGRKAWGRVFPITGEKLYNMTDEAFDKAVTNTMRQQLSLVAQMHYARLDKIFPGFIKDVTSTYNSELATKIIKVLFHNGHVAEAPEGEAKSDLFTAKCSMLYDLPPI